MSFLEKSRRKQRKRKPKKGVARGRGSVGHPKVVGLKAEGEGRKRG